ncbi:MAG: FAD-dependent oxidoreductase [bacterium]
MEKKVGVYICTGCGIGEALDAKSLAKVATSEQKVPICKSHEFLCGAEGLDMLRKDMGQEGVNTLVIAACSKRAKTEAFSFDPTQVCVERVNIREHVAWCQPAGEEDTQMLGEDYLRMGIVKAKKMEPLAPFKEETSKKILVVGGGVTGMTAAREAAVAGYEVVLVEKEVQLGGYAAKLHKTFPQRAPYLEIENTNVAALIQEVEAQPKITIYKGAALQKTAGAPGLFDVTIQQNGSSETVRVGAIVEAAGFAPYDAGKLGHLGYGECTNVVTHFEVEQMAKAGKIQRPSDGKAPKAVAFIQCAGSRDPKHLAYCSATCCMTSLKQAKYIRNANTEAKVYILYKDMRTPGQYENFYKQVQQDEGVFLTKGEVTSVVEDADKGVRIQVEKTLLGDKIEIQADLVVLATGMVSNAALGEELVVKLADEGDDKKKGEEAQEPPADRIIRSNILNLAYRQGPELPALKYGFPDSHYVCFPYESRRTGIYPAGAVRQPMDAAMATEDATGAALKAIQCVEMVARGEATHPRSGDLSYPELFLQRCTQCKRCTAECPFGMYDEDEKGTPKPNPTRCRRCGICMGSCPERIISFKDFSVDIIGSMVKTIEVPEEDEEKPRVVCFICENDAYPAVDIAGLRRMQYSPFVRFIPLRCLGDMNIVWIADSLSKGIDGVMLIGCKYGDDYQCHFMKGSELANYRMGKIQETLTRLALESDRIRVHQLSINEYDQIPKLVTDFMAKIEEVGPNPYKGF